MSYKYNPYRDTFEHMDDTIYRQAAIDLWVWGDTDMAVHSRVVHVEDIEALPSAQPDRSLWFRVGEICVDESKGFVSSSGAVEKIRELLRAERRTDAAD